MRKLILVSATQAEVQPLLDRLREKKVSENSYQINDLHLRVCITGVGVVNTALQLGMLHHEHFDLALNVGICGTFGTESPGTVVAVRSDCFSEMGAEDGEKFLDLESLGFGSAEVRPVKQLQHGQIQNLPQLKGITVNTVHGSEASITAIMQRLSPQVESMEGAAFFTAANAMGWTCAQIRAVSNKVETRNRANWNISLALKNLEEVVWNIVMTL